MPRTRRSCLLVRCPAGLDDFERARLKRGILRSLARHHKRTKLPHSPSLSIPETSSLICTTPQSFKHPIHRMPSDYAYEKGKPEASGTRPSNVSRTKSNGSHVSMNPNDAHASGTSSSNTTSLGMQRWLQETPADEPWSATSRTRSQEPAYPATSGTKNAVQGMDGKTKTGKGKHAKYPFPPRSMKLRSVTDEH